MPRGLHARLCHAFLVTFLWPHVYTQCLLWQFVRVHCSIIALVCCVKVAERLLLSCSTSGCVQATAWRCRDFAGNSTLGCREDPAQAFEGDR